MVKTDSKYSISCIEEWVHNWRRRGWRTADGKPVKNRSVIEYLSGLVAQRARRGQKVRFKYVRGHVGIEGNEGADAQANLGALLPVLAERNWAAAVKKLEMESRGKAEGAGAVEEAPVEFDIREGDLLSPEELEEMGLTQNFD